MRKLAIDCDIIIDEHPGAYTALINNYVTSEMGKTFKNCICERPRLVNAAKTNSGKTSSREGS